MNTEYAIMVTLVSCGVLILLMIVILLLAIAIWPKWTRRRALRLRARQDYLNARGTIHRQLLTEAMGEVEFEAKVCESQLQTARNRRSALQSQRDRELNEAYARFVVSRHFRDIYGIGPKLEQQILHTVFRGNLADLHRAHEISGVGWARQGAISQWVREYEAQKPAMVKEGFPGQKQISDRHDLGILAAEKQVDTLTVQLKKLRKREDTVRAGLDRLANVTEKDFVEAMRNPDNPSDRLTIYLSGAYDEWESMPDWFQKAVVA